MTQEPNHTIKIDYILSEIFQPPNIDLIDSFDEMTLRYNAFSGDFVLKINESDFSAKWGWVQIFDMALVLVYCTDLLFKSETGEQTIDFTENTALIYLVRLDTKRLKISPDYVAGEEIVSIESWAMAVKAFFQKICHELPKKYNKLNQNETFRILVNSYQEKIDLW